MAAQAAANAAGMRHTDIDDLISVSLAASSRNVPIQDIDASNPRGKLRNVVDGDVFESALNQSKCTLRHV